MEVNEQSILNWTRVVVIFVGMAWAAWLDHLDRKVPNQHWIDWAKPAIFVWYLDLMLQGADWTIYLTASAVIAYASVSVFGQATMRDAIEGSRIDRWFLVWYTISFVGLVAGAAKYQSTTPLEVIQGTGDPLGMLWWRTLGALLVVVVINLTWRLRLLHGGADAKALIWVTLLFPSWDAVAIIMPNFSSEAVVSLPVAFSLLMWGAFAFLFIPLVLLIQNLRHGFLRSFSDLRLAWHSTMMSIDEVEQRHVWLLSTMMVRADGSTCVTHRLRAPKQTPSSEALHAQVVALKEAGIDMVWVSFKIPLLVFLLPALLPLLLFGDPIAVGMQWLISR